MSFESPDVLPGRASVWQVQPGGRGGFTKYCAVADSCLHSNCNPTCQTCVCSAQERGEDEEKSLGGEIVLGGVTAFVGVGGGEEEEESLDEAASAGSVVGRLTEVSWVSLAL